MILSDDEILKALGYTYDPGECYLTDARAVIAAYEAKLREQNEPVAWVGRIEDGAMLLMTMPDDWTATPLFEHPAPIPEWKPIETAPSGDGVLISIGDSVIRAMFIQEFTLEDNGNYLGDSSYKEENDTYYWPEGWYEWDDHEDTHWLVDAEPTHWMPLPKPPVAARSGE